MELDLKKSFIILAREFLHSMFAQRIKPTRSLNYILKIDIRKLVDSNSAMHREVPSLNLTEDMP